jgi:hypothetical protein
MAYRSKDIFKIENTDAFASGSNKWTGDEVQGQFANVADSAMWIDQKVTMAGLNFDCSISTLQEKTLTVNSTLTVSNAVAGQYYTLIKKGAYTLNLPAGEYSANGSVTGTGTTIVTFFFDGTDYFFNFATYSII